MVFLVRILFHLESKVKLNPSVLFLVVKMWKLVTFTVNVLMA